MLYLYSYSAKHSCYSSWSKQYSRASVDMEENEVKEEDRQRTTGGEWFDLNKLSDLLCELDAVATQVGNIF